MLKILNRKKESLKPLYTNCDIPAKLFFEIMHTGDYSKLGTGNVSKAFDDIFDEYFLISDKKELKQYLIKKHKIELLVNIINGISTTVAYLKDLSITHEQVIMCVEILNRYDEVKPKFNPDPLKAISEIERIEKRVIGMLKNQLNTLNDGKEKTTQKIKQTFQKSLLSIRLVLDGISVDEDISLYMYAELENAVKEKIQQQKKLSNGK